MDLYELLLPNGRGVRFRLISPSEHDEASVAAGNIVGTAADTYAAKIAMRQAQLRECTKRMLYSVTARSGLTLEDLPKPETQWKTLSSQDLVLPGEWQYDKLFGAKEDAILTSLYTRYHELTREEAESIVGKVRTVSAG